MSRRTQHPSRLSATLLDLLALGWLARGLWRMSRGRAPWRGA